MYGFLFDDRIGKNCIYIDANVTYKTLHFLGFNKEFMFNNWNKLLGSKYLYYFLMLLMKIIFKIQLKIVGNPKLTIPLKEKGVHI